MPGLHTRSRSWRPATLQPDPYDAAGAIADTLAEPGPALLRNGVDPESDCLPMFRPGGAAREMIGYTST